MIFRQFLSKLSLTACNALLSIDIMENRKIRTTVEFLDMLREHYKYLSEDGKTPVTDYRVGKELGVSHQAVTGWRTGRTTFNDEMCLKVANILGLHAEYVLGCVHLERSSSGIMRDFWQGLALAAPYAKHRM